MLPPSVMHQCEQILGAPISAFSRLSGGDINEARLVEASGRKYFLKMNDMPGAYQMFRAEAEGLTLIGKSGKIKVPQVLASGQAGQTSFLLMEYINPGHRNDNFWEEFGYSLAQLHKISHVTFGLHAGNYIGSLPQSNRTHENWLDFFIFERIEPQLQYGFKNKQIAEGDRQMFEKLYELLPSILPLEPPALIHGDLWGGNFLADETGQAVLIDPAVSYSHREMDLAMSRLFGGFSPGFYRAYQAAYPLENGLEERIEIYQLYYLLVHVNLFGGGYINSVRQILRRFT